MQKQLTLVLTGDSKRPMVIEGSLGDMPLDAFFTVVFRHSKEWRDMMQRAIKDSKNVQ
jgi:hypothetical protein